MTRKQPTSPNVALPPRRYRGADVPLAVIRRYARQVAKRFKPDKIVLFGSHAYGTPHADSDVDILVVMSARDELGQAFKVRLACPAPFPMDLIVRTPQSVAGRIEEGESFTREIMTQGKVLYEKDDAGMGAKSRGRSPARNRHPARKRAVS